MRLDRLRSALDARGISAISVSAVSRNVVDAAIEIANERRHPVILSVSTDQVDCAENGGGMLDAWTTPEFVDRVRRRDDGGWILIRRQHAGLQNRGADGAAALRRTLTADVEAGFDIVHVDASVDDRGRRLTDSEEIDLQTAMYAHAVEAADRLGYDVAFEIGGRQRSGDDDSLDDFAPYFEASMARLDDTGLPRPLLVHARIGTFVEEFANIGRLETAKRGDERRATRDAIASAVSAAASAGVSLSVTDADYLAPENLDALAELGIGVVGVGPSMGVRETMAFIDMCDATRSASIRGDFLEAAFATGIWERLLGADSQSCQFERAVLCGHHVFGTAAFREFKARLQSRFGSAGIDVDSSLRRSHVDQLNRLLERLQPSIGLELAPVAG